MGLWKTIILLIWGTLFLSFQSYAQVSPTKPLRKINLQLVWKHQFQFAGYYAAKAKGFYQAAGFDVNILEGDPKITPVDEVINGRANFGVSRGELLLHRLQGKPVVVLASIFQHSPVILLTKKSSGISTPHDMIGKRVMLLQGADNAVYMAMFKNEGISLDKLKVQQSTFNPQDLLDNKTDVFNAYTTNEPFFMNQKGVAYNIINPIKYGIDFYGDNLFTSEEELNHHAADVKAFREASLKGWDYALSHIDEIADLIIKEYGVKKSKEHLQFEARAIHDLVMPDLIQMGHMNTGRWEHMAKTYSDLGLGPKKYSIQGFIYDTNPPKDHRPLYLMLTISICVLIFSAIVLIILSIFNRHLKKEVQRRTEELEKRQIELETANSKLQIEITERSKAELETKKLQNLLSNIINSMPSVLISIDSNEKITQWNKKAEEVTQIPSWKAQGRKFTEVLPNELEYYARLKESMTHLKAVEKRKSFKKIKDETHYEDITVFPLINQQLQGAVIRIDNVSERIRLEEMMIQSEKMLSLGGLAAGMAHEINNPLTGMIQNAEIIEKRLFDDSPRNQEAAEKANIKLEQLRSYLQNRSISEILDNIRSSGIRAAIIVQNMLSFARKSDQAISSYDVSQLFDQTLELAKTDYDLKRHYDFRQIEIIKEYAQDLPLIPCDKTKLQQVFLNILKNGAQAMSANNQAVLRFIIRLQKKENSIWIEIEDNGPGMDEVIAKRIFEPFFTTKPVGQGTGLGLSVSYFIITETHGGELLVETEKDKGTRFIIKLPLEGKPK